MHAFFWSQGHLDTLKCNYTEMHIPQRMGGRGFLSHNLSQLLWSIKGNCATFCQSSQSQKVSIPQQLSVTDLSQKLLQLFFSIAVVCMLFLNTYSLKGIQTILDTKRIQNSVSVCGHNHTTIIKIHSLCFFLNKQYKQSQ